MAPRRWFGTHEPPASQRLISLPLPQIKFLVSVVRALASFSQRMAMPRRLP